jgi:hypothetical protein
MGETKELWEKKEKIKKKLWEIKKKIVGKK